MKELKRIILTNKKGEQTHIDDVGEHIESMNFDKAEIVKEITFIWE